MIQYNTILHYEVDKAHIMTDKEKLYKYYHYNLNGQTKDENLKKRKEENNYIRYVAQRKRL